MSDIDPKISLEIERARAELKQYTIDKSAAARNTAIGVLTFVAAVLGIAAMFGIDQLVAMRISSDIEKKVINTIEEDLPTLVNRNLQDNVPEMIKNPIQEYLVSNSFSKTIENALSLAVQREFDHRVPGSVIEFISAQKNLIDDLDDQAEEARKSMEAMNAERAFLQREFDEQRESNIFGTWRPSGLLGQIHAQATCVALAKTSGWITAIPRQCEAEAPTCEEVCASAGVKTNDIQITSANNRLCEAAIHIYQNLPSSDINRVGLKTFKYPNCRQTACGPNYCCCSSF